MTDNLIPTPHDTLIPHSLTHSLIQPLVHPLICLFPKPPATLVAHYDAVSQNRNDLPNFQSMHHKPNTILMEGQIKEKKMMEMDNPTRTLYFSGRFGVTSLDIFLMYYFKDRQYSYIHLYCFCFLTRRKLKRFSSSYPEQYFCSRFRGEKSY